MEFKIGEYKYRTKEMNAIEAFAMRTQMSNETYAQSLTATKLVLEHLEVEIAGVWQPVKTPGKEIYLPADVEKDTKTVAQLITTYLRDYFNPLF